LGEIVGEAAQERVVEGGSVEVVEEGCAHFTVSVKKGVLSATMK